MTETEQRIRSAIIEIMGVDILENTTSRKREILYARHIYAYLSLDLQPTRGVTAISRTICKDHTTIINSNKTVMDLVDTDSSFKMLIKKIKAKARAVNCDVKIHVMSMTNRA